MIKFSYKVLIKFRKGLFQMKKFDLNKNWKLSMHSLSCGINELFRVKNCSDFMDADLPCDIHTPLLKYEKITNPVVGENYKDALWVEEKSWWFSKTFTVTEEMLSYPKLNLVFERLDCMADIFINDTHIGTHKSVFYPFCHDVKKYLTVGENSVYVRVTTGLEHVKRLDTENMTICDFFTRERSDYRRTMLRKPQHVFGWDWCPRIPTCGITGNAYLEGVCELNISSVHASTLSINESALLKLEVETKNINISRSINAEISADIIFDGETVAHASKAVFVKSGINFTDFYITVESPKLWWPNGYGEQNMYCAKIEVCYGGKCETFEQKFGIRTINISTDALNEAENEFVFVINGKRIFAKGGNWIPSDSIYTEITPEKLDTLINSARDLNFNILRIWGGGLYENDVFYELCDKYGMLVWHDFMFACSMVPDRNDEYFALVQKEFEYQIKRIRNHPSMALWCGSNENHQFYEIWQENLEFFGGEKIYNYLAPQYVRNLSPEIPYWNSSPYGGPFAKSNDAGDEHCWENHLLGDDKDRAISLVQYDLDTAKFVSEYGHLGPCCKKSIFEFMGTENVDMQSSAFITHNNTMNHLSAQGFDDTGLIERGIIKYYNNANPTLDEYIKFGGMVQGITYAYSIDAHRIQSYCGGNIIWMYNDCWGEAGWTPIDYYLRRKPSYYFIKRAYAMQRMILRKSGDSFSLFFVNDSYEDVNKEICVGYTSFDGKTVRENKLSVSAPHGITKLITELTVSENELKNGAVYAYDTAHELDKAIYRTDSQVWSDIPASEVSIDDIHFDGKDTFVTVTSNAYAHGVYIEDAEEWEVSDLYFDLLPNESKTIVIKNRNISDIIVKTVNG